MSALQRLFRKYSREEISPEEKAMVDAWYDSYDAQHMDLAGQGPGLQQERRGYPEIPAGMEQEIRQSIWNRLQTGLEDGPASLPGEPDRIGTVLNGVPAGQLLTYEPGDLASAVPVRRIWFRYGAAAAVAGLLFAAAGLLIRYKHRAPESPEYVSIRTGNKEHKQVQLPDGSTIHLDPGSVIRFGKSLDGPSREVFMPEGEAWYAIAPDNHRPFIVHAGQLTVRVLGTSFNIRTMSGVQEQAVLVREGKVQVQQRDQVLGVLTAGRQLIYDTVSGKFQVYEHKDLLAEQLAKGWLVLDDASFALMRAMLRARYGVEIADPAGRLAGAHFTASFRPDAPLEAVMQVLCSIHPVQYQLRDGVIHIQ